MATHIPQGKLPQGILPDDNIQGCNNPYFTKKNFTSSS